MSVPKGTPGLNQEDRDSLANLFRHGGTFCVQLLPFPALAHLAWALRAEFKRPMVWITDGAKTLDVLHQDLLTLRGERADQLSFYPAWESLPGSGQSPPADLIGDRLATLLRCRGPNKPAILVTCVQALMQKTISPETLGAQTLDLKKGSETDLTSLIQHLESMGYTLGHEVLGKGQASHRGGIVDVWPPTSGGPFRIEFFGTTVESIRTFNPAGQQSVAPQESALISPAGEIAMDGTFFDYVPANAVWISVEPDSMGHHAALYREIVSTAGASAMLTDMTVPESATQISFNTNDDALDHRLGYAPLEDVPAFEGNALRPDLADEMRQKYLEQLKRRASEGWTILLYFSTEGARDRFVESRADAVLFDIRLGALSEGFEYASAKLMVVTERDLFGRRKELRGRYELQSRRTAATRAVGERIADWTDLQPGDLVVHVDHGIGKYLGLFEIQFSGALQEVLTIEYAEKARLYVPVSQSHLLSRYVGVGKHRPNVHALGGGRWQKDKIAAEQAVQDLAATLLQTQAARDAKPGHAFSKDVPWQHEFEASFPFNETPDQEEAIEAVKRDMESTRPMDRLVCGDVGYGKTEVAMRAAFKAVMGGKQAAMLVPTTVLAQQHYDTFTRRMGAWPVRIEMLSRFQTPAEQDAIVDRLVAGTVDVVIGTHRLVQKDVQFKDLGLVIIDEEQRFGVKHKEHLKQMRQLVDVLTLTATPIPRTLYLSLTGAKDLSTIQTPPVERLPIETIVAENNDEVVRRAILSELNREGQIFYLHNRVHSIDNVRLRLRKIVPEARIEVAHGQMPEKQLAFIMRAFVRGDFDLLLCTTIIESGLDIPNVNTILIDRADRFGLAELYQLRGRVGRYKRKAYAYLLLPKHGQLFDVARKRIGAIKRYSHLGAGFKLAMRDLEIRGAGNILGAEQSGHIAAVGFDLYCQLLKRTVAHLRGETPPPIVDVATKLDFLNFSPSAMDDYERTAAIPTSYMEDENQRISIYRKIAGAGTSKELSGIRAELRDRFGKTPRSIDLLMDVAQLRIDAAARNISSIETQGEKVLLMRRGDFITRENKFPRLKAKSASDKLDELRRIVRQSK